MDDLNNNKKIDWDDDSGEIHTQKEVCKTDFSDGWQENTSFGGTNKGLSYTHSKFIGKSTEIHYVTDDYRKVIPAYIIVTLFIIVLCVVMLCVKLSIGLIFSVFGVVWIIGLWAKAPHKKWKNQHKKLNEEKYKEK